MKTYWLHIVENKSPQLAIPSSYLLARTDAPGRNDEAGGMPTVHYASWQQLATKLSAVGIDGGLLQDTKEGLDSKGNQTITEVKLAHAQAEQLGFVDLST